MICKQKREDLKSIENNKVHTTETKYFLRTKISKKLMILKENISEGLNPELFYSWQCYKTGAKINAKIDVFNFLKLKIIQGCESNMENLMTYH